MRYEFSITDEKTLENDTAKVIVQVTGPADAPRADLEQRVRTALSAFLPKADWAYSGLSIIDTAYPMFSITASVRINAAENDDLQRKATNYASENPEAKASIKVTNIDMSMPLFKTREGERVVRQNIYKIALDELNTLKSIYSGNGKLRIKSISFSSNAGHLAEASMNFSNAATSSYERAGGSGPIGSFSKIYQNASVVITDGEDEPQAEIINGAF